MKNAIENIIEENANSNLAVHKQYSWVSSIIEKIGAAIEDERAEMNINFPLSGGEDHVHIVHSRHRDDGGQMQVQPKKRKWSSFFDDLETEFPLSGGEIER